MPKNGILNDYDLKANEEESAKKKNTCIVCGAYPTIYQWSDYSGEAMCTKCGCAYQLKWGSEKQKKENNYPYQNIRNEFIPVMKEYWDEIKKFVYYGRKLGGNNPGWKNFVKWLRKKHPEKGWF